MGALLEARDLEVVKGGRRILAIHHLEVAEGEVLGLVGPNGAGKTTLLMVLAGLEPSFCGRLWVRGRLLDRRRLLAHRRSLGVVFQDPQVLDATVLANVVAPLRYRGVPKAEARRRAELWLERVGIGHLAGQPARVLSGGERQRLALARALVTEPQILLLDEPFSSLDAPARGRLMADLRQVLGALGITAVVVSHDFTEVLLLARRVVVLTGGRVRQVGEAREVFWRPADAEVARLVGVENIWRGEVVTGPAGLRVRVDGVELKIPGDHRPGPVQVGVRPEAVVLAPDGPAPAPAPDAHAPAADGPAHAPDAGSAAQAGSAAEDCSGSWLRGKVGAVVPSGPLVRVELSEPLTLSALVPRARAMGVAPGDTVRVFIPPESLHVFDYSPGT